MVKKSKRGGYCNAKIKSDRHSQPATVCGTRADAFSRPRLPGSTGH